MTYTHNMLLNGTLRKMTGVHMSLSLRQPIERYGFVPSVIMSGLRISKRESWGKDGAKNVKVLARNTLICSKNGTLN